MKYLKKEIEIMELVIKNLHAKVEDKEILKGVNLTISTVPCDN